MRIPISRTAAPIAVTACLKVSGPIAPMHNFQSGAVSVYSIDAHTGALTQIAGSPFKLQDNSRTLAISE
jgi:hypothetical protein